MQVCTRFLGIVDVVDGTANTIYKALMDLCSKLKIDMSKLCGFGSDGAAVMLGQKSGVSILSNH